MDVSVWTTEIGSIMAKREKVAAKSIGQYRWRDDAGRLRAVEILRPKKGPTSTSVAAIQRAIRETNAARKAK